jgi:hypothetical protein
MRDYAKAMSMVESNLGERDETFCHGGCVPGSPVRQ